MYDTSVNIKFLSNEGGLITVLSLPNCENNISGDDVSLKTSSDGMNLNLLGYETVNRFAMYPNNCYDGKIINVMSDDLGVCDYTFTIDGSGITHLAIFFDKIAGEWANELVINGVKYLNDDYFFAVTGLLNLSRVTVQITKWNKPKRWLRVTSVELSLELDFKKFSALKRNLSASNSSKMVSYGLTLNDGGVYIQDEKNRLETLCCRDILKDGLVVNVKFHSSVIGEFTTKNVVLQSNIARMDFVSKLKNLQNENFVGYALPMTQSGVVAKTAVDILREIYKPQIIMDLATENRLRNTVYTYPIVESDTKFNVLNMLLKSVECVMTENENGIAEVIYVG